MYIAFNKSHQTNIRQKLFTNLLSLNMKETAGIFNDLAVTEFDSMRISKNEVLLKLQ
jgi:hypothetical protein